MITKVTSENKGLYKSLFERASLALGDDATIIDSLDKYFSKIATLSNNYSQTFSYLPLDEPTFDINADTRVITVPSDFKKNGISVKGDHYAETIYFTIDRYYDTTDLYDPNIKIIIQWEDPDKKQGVSLAAFKDIEIFKHSGKLLIGWALNNTITKAPGAIKFSVRFYELNAEQEVVFSLSTLTANAIINPGLDYQFTNGQLADDITFFDEDAQKLQNRLRDSEYSDPDVTPDTPTFVINLPAGSVDLDMNNEYSFVAKAESTEGVVTYIWKFIPTGSNETMDLSLSAGAIYTQTDDTAWDASKVYYQRTETNGVVAYEVVENGTDGDPISGDLTLYEKKNGLSVSHHGDPAPAVINGVRNPSSITGTYWVIARNRIGLGTADAESKHTIIPGPGALNVTAPTAELSNVILTGATTGNAQLRATATTENEGDTISYNWFVYDTEEEEEIFTAIEGASSTLARGVQATYDIPTVSADDRTLYDRTFAVKVAAIRNGDATDAQTFKYRVTDAAHKPTVVLSTSSPFTSADRPAIVTVRVTNPLGIIHDEFIYEWYKYLPEEDSEEFQIIDDPIYREAVTSTETELQIEIPEAGNYYCKVINVVNGSQSDAWVPSSLNECVILSSRS